MAEQGDRHDLQPRGLRRLDRLLDGRAFRQRRRLGEQVEHALAGCRRQSLGPIICHDLIVRGVHPRSFMLIAFDDGSAVHELEVVVHDPDATVADLVRALDPTQAHRSLAVDGIRRPSDRRLDRAAITTGATVTLSDEPLGTLSDERSGDRPTARRPPLATLRVAGGLEAGEQAELRIGRVSVGRGAPLVGLRSTTVSAHHAELTVDGDGRVTVADRGSRNGTWLDGRQVVAPTPVRPGSVLRVGASHLVAAAPVEDRPSALAVARTTGPATVPFNRPPRPATPTATAPVEPPTPPATRAPPHPVGVVSVVAPIAMGLLMVVVFDSLLFGLFALLSPVVLLGTALESRRRGRRGGRRDRQRYDRELAAFRTTLAARAEVARERLVEVLPDPAEVVRRATTPSTRLWERRRDHPDALLLRVGIGPVPWDPPVRGETGRLPADVAAAIDDAGVLLDAPVALDLSEGTVVGVVGHRAAALAVARSLVLQAATHHGPVDLGLAVVVSPDHATDWDWVKWLPHTIDPGGSSARRLTADRESADRLFRAMLDEDVDAPRLVVLDDEDVTEGRRAPARSLLRRAAVAGIVVATTDDRLPALCSTVIELRDGDGTARVRTGSVVARWSATCWPPGSPTPPAARVGSCAGAVRRSGAGGGGGRPAPGRRPAPAAGSRPTHRRRRSSPGGRRRGPIPTCSSRSASPRTGCWRSTSCGTVRTRSSRARPARARASCCAHWSPGSRRRAPPTTSPSCWSTSRAAAPSTGAQGCPTRSGSSPTSTRTWHSARSAAWRPSCVTASAPLRAAGVADLTEHRRRPHQGPPLPRLVVVVDEFATLKAELPDFVESLVGVAQRGRSLGVHLVLATQRPSGAVSESIRANTNLRIALRVQDAADSTDVIDRPDAARLGRNQPGRALVRLGPGEVELDPDRAGDRPSRRPVTGRWWSGRSGSGRDPRRAPAPRASPIRVRSPTSSGSSTRRRRRTAGRDGRRLGGRGRTRCRPRSSSTR